jgi:hypothetical protein
MRVNNSSIFSSGKQDYGITPFQGASKLFWPKPNFLNVEI